jgi:hypothetical protein
MKALLTSGCSFSEGRGTHQQYISKSHWPYFLSLYSSPKYTLHTGRPSIGNDIISRKAFYQVHEALKHHESKDITLILQWSGLSRRSFLGCSAKGQSGRFSKVGPQTDNVYDTEYLMKYSISINGPSMNNENNADYLTSLKYNNEELNIEPTWVQMGPWETVPLVQHYYYSFDSESQQLESTLWNMLSIQNLCSLHNINYHWMTHTNDFNNMIEKHGTEYQCEVLLDKLNTDNRILDIGIMEWLQEHYPDQFDEDGFHPNKFGHRNFTKEVILPYLGLTE